MIDIREELPGDEAAVRLVNLAAFEDGPEADLVDRLRAAGTDYRSFVAIEHDEIVGHILFTPAAVDGQDLVGMGLAPMAVTPARQRQGIGSELVRYGLEQLRAMKYPFVVVLGHPEYYPRFGFERASCFGFRSQWEGVPDEVFMVTVFDPAALPAGGGVVRYRIEFGE